MRVQLWCAAGVDLTGWRAYSQEALPVKGSSGSSDPLHADENGAGKKSNHASPEKKKVKHIRCLYEVFNIGCAMLMGSVEIL